jgi:long-chain acyl-CoA synthetase
VEVLTAARSEDDQSRIAGGLRRAGLRPGDRVALLTRSGGRMLSAILGALRTGVVPVLVNSALLPHERDALLADADPALVVDDAALARLADAAPVELAAAPLARPMHYTSGTTGTPRGVWSGLLDEGEALDLLAEEAEVWRFGADDVHLVCSPFHHSVAIRFGGGTLLAGGTVVVLERFDAAGVVDAVARYRPTTTFMVPAHLQRLFALVPVPDRQQVLPGFRLVAHAGAPCPEPLKRAAIDAFGADAVWEFYGSTEGQFTVCSSPEWLERPGTVGRARPRRRLDVDDDGVIWCEAPAYARWEYWRAPERTAAAWRGPSFTVGDLGRLDDDGYLFLDGRRDDLIITGGVNVYPAEVEGALADAPGVEQIAVFGVDDERWGQRVCAAVVGDVDAEAIRAHARARLAPYKRPKQLFVVAELPHTVTGKLQRSRLPEMLGGGD